jgi:phosphatidylinositol-3-phosphatase
MMKKAALFVITMATALLASTTMFAQEQKVPDGIQHLDHVWVIMMENHAYSQIIGNTNAPFINSYSSSANLATNYYGVAHPSLTNYLEVIGGSNFGVINDFSPDWHNMTCTPNIVSGVPSLESATANICPIAGKGMDGATPAIDTTNEGTPTAPIQNYPAYAPAKTIGKSIADQLNEHGMSWKSYQENLPPYGADRVNNSDGLISDVTASEPGLPKLYAVKHNPFAYFENVQEHELKKIVGFDKLFADLAGGNVPNFSLISPNQCHDQHGRGSSEMGTGCSVDQNAIAQGDAALSVLIKAIKASPAWAEGHNVIVTVWDENDYGTEPNQVVAIVDTNSGPKPLTSGTFYNHFSLLKTLEGGFGLPCLNHACDSASTVMSDLFRF